MGIRNITLSRSRSWSSATHYPSWGSEPAPIYAPESDVPDQASLPLMGIRNTIGDTFTVAGFFRSLPLMGIRNIDASEKLPPQGTPLTTPHGDRGDVPAAVEFGRVAAAPVNTLRQQPHRCQEISVCF